MRRNKQLEERILKFLWEHEEWRVTRYTIAQEFTAASPKELEYAWVVLHDEEFLSTEHAWQPFPQNEFTRLTAKGGVLCERLFSPNVRNVAAECTNREELLRQLRTALAIAVKYHPQFSEVNNQRDPALWRRIYAGARMTFEPDTVLADTFAAIFPLVCPGRQHEYEELRAQLFAGNG